MKLASMGWVTALAQQEGGPSIMMLLFGLLLAMFVFMTIAGRGKRKEQQAREKMLADLSRNDKVITIGGLVGVVTDVKDDEITLKVDEGNNTRIRMKKWSVRALEAGESGDDKK